VNLMVAEVDILTLSTRVYSGNFKGTEMKLLNNLMRSTLLCSLRPEVLLRLTRV
jgi:hypothetical protein